MYASTHPGKEAAREYLRQRLREGTPPPAQSEVRRRLGWALVKPHGPSGTLGASHWTTEGNR
jgi:hypothetical protein